MLCANGFFRYCGRRYTPGEIIEQKIDPETLEWLEEQNAVIDTEKQETAEPETQTEEKPKAKRTKAKNPSTVEEDAGETDGADIDPTESISIRRRKR